MGFSKGNILGVVVGIKRGCDGCDIDGAVIGTIVGANDVNDEGLRKGKSDDIILHGDDGNIVGTALGDCVISTDGALVSDVLVLY